jgi:LysM repeat protein
MNIFHHYFYQIYKKQYIYKVFSFVLFLVLSFSAKAHQYTGDTTGKYLTIRDTIFVTPQKIGGIASFIFEHTFRTKQTAYSLAKFHGCYVEELMPLNPSLNLTVLKDGQVIKLPIHPKGIKRFHPKDLSRWRYVPICLRVKHGDNLTNLANWFKMPIDTLLKRNKLVTPALTSGQILHIGWYPITGIPDSLRRSRADMQATLNMQLLGKQFEAKKQYEEQKGAAFWLKGGHDNGGFYCLHRNAKAGSVLQVTNPMTGVNIFAKVIGKIPERTYGNDVLVIISPTVAKRLGAKDERFFVKIKYQK